MKIKSLTLKQAEALLKTTDHPFPKAVIRRAVMDGKLRANLHREAVSYYTVIEDDLLEWAANTNLHKPGDKTK